MKYEDIEALNWSTLKKIMVSPKWLRHLALNPKEDVDKDSYRLGRAAHCATLEPERYKTDYIVQPDFGNMNKNSNKEAKVEWLHSLLLDYVEMDLPDCVGMNEKDRLNAELSYLGDAIPEGELEIITNAEHETSMRIADAIMSDHHARRLIEDSRIEHAAQWIDEDTSIKCKGRMDAVSYRVTDIKTTRRKTRRTVLKDAADFDYHGQLSWYHDGAIRAGLIDGHHLPAIIAVHAPLTGTFVDVAVLDMGLDPDTYEQGRALYKRLIKQYAGCLASDMWPGMAPNVVQWQLPAYKLED